MRMREPSRPTVLVPWQTALSPRPRVEDPKSEPFQKPFAGWEPTPDFEQGPWHYICVDPAGLHLRWERRMNAKGGDAMYVGDMVTIIERGEEGGVLWLCLADGRGWAFERQGKRRVFSEVRYKAVSPEMTAKELMVCPRLEQDVELPDTPHIPLGAVGCSLAAGSVVRVLGHATVVLGTRSMKDVTGMFGGTEVGRTFYRVVNEKRLRGWIPATYTARDEDWTLIDFRYEHVSRSSDEVGAGVSAPPSGWASVVSSTRVPLCPLPGRSSTPTSRLEPGELLEVVGKLSAANLTFYRLQEGGWGLFDRLQGPCSR